MKLRNIAGSVMSVALAAGLVLAVSGCFGIPKGTMKDVKVGTVELTVTGAGIVKADAQKTVFKIKCGKCGYETGEMVIDTPVPGKPYILNWVCPRCGHKQKIVIQVAG